jgi:hypothetical protein
VTSAMTHLCCPHCRMRFTPAAAASLTACPDCGGPTQPIAGPRRIMGFRLVGLEDLRHDLPHAEAVALPAPTPGGTRP